MISENKWDDHENDHEVISIQNSLEEKRVAKVKIHIEMERERSMKTATQTTVRRRNSPPEWGQETGPLAPNPNFAPQQWQRFSWGNSSSPHDPEPGSLPRGEEAASVLRPPNPILGRDHLTDKESKTSLTQKGMGRRNQNRMMRKHQKTRDTIFTLATRGRNQEP